MNALRKISLNRCIGAIFVRAKYIPDEWYLKIVYRAYIGTKLSLKNPAKFNEKLKWLKLYDRKPEYTRMVDKYEVKKYVKDRIGVGVYYTYSWGMG